MTQQILIDKHLSSLQVSENTTEAALHSSPATSHILVDKNNLPSSETDVDSDSRVELLERSLHYIQQQHNITLVDLHNEINRLQQENKDLHYRLLNTLPVSPSEQKQRRTDHRSSTLNKPLDNNHLHLEQKIDTLEKQLNESEQKNNQLIQTITELNKVPSSKLELSNTNIENTDVTRISIQRTDDDYEQLLATVYEKQEQYIQEITKLRSVILEILNTERLSTASKVLLRDSLTSTTINEISLNKISTTPIDMLFMDGNQQQGSITSSSTAGKTASFRHELPLRRLNISPPQAIAQRSTGQQRMNLPPVMPDKSSSLFQDPMSMTGLFHQALSPTNYSAQQHLIKVGETSIARRERRTQELQKNRLLKNLYH